MRKARVSVIAMAGFENYAEEVREIEQEIERKGIILGIDWNDDVQVYALAREALDDSLALRAIQSEEDTSQTSCEKPGFRS